MIPSTCSTSSHTANEQLFATATRVDTWFLLEHNRPYGAKALAESDLPPQVKQKMEAAAAAVSNGRVQLIRHGRRGAGNGLAFFVAVNHEEQPNLYEFRLDRVEDLLDLDLAAIAAEDQTYRGHDRTEPLFLVCTNGRRDPCCARLGLPLYRAMRREYGTSVWETAHIGGHRFAPTLVALPSGAVYGYASPGSAAYIVEATRASRLHLPNYRGRSCYAAHVQAADTFLRRHTGKDGLLQYKLISVDPQGENVRMFHFRDRSTGEDCCVRVRSIPEAVKVRKSCSETEMTAISQYVAELIEVFHS